MANRTRQIKKQVWLNEQEVIELQRKAKKGNMSEAEVIRNLIMDSEIKEKPDDRFYEEMKQLRAIGNNLNQIARRANALRVIDSFRYEEEAKRWNNFICKIKKEFLYSSRKKIYGNGENMES